MKDNNENKSSCPFCNTFCNQFMYMMLNPKYMITCGIVMFVMFLLMAMLFFSFFRCFSIKIERNCVDNSQNHEYIKK